ncbi:WYL domain-containing protein [Methanoplanus limicola]|uniref:WYL domain-containing protein n=1 Tax=Methanoplanus limicola DSM 2279 TaxID=937775 RepID=H1Z1G1_9EURY|nr:hypothetical protein [Methanoplanus limicola]EHQ36308.1 hypothetical protein Metlim_2249 [Methanoplanus limicola DSM 2279]
MHSKICDAIKTKNQIKIIYDGQTRIINPHLIGIHHKSGKKTLRAYQVGGHSNSGKIPDWRMYSIDKISSVSHLDNSFEINQGYNPNDSHMSSIICRV